MYLSCLGCRSESEMAGESVVKVLNLEASLTDLQSSLKVAKKKFFLCELKKHWNRFHSFEELFKNKF